MVYPLHINLIIQSPRVPCLPPIHHNVVRVICVGNRFEWLHQMGRKGLCTVPRNSTSTSSDLVNGTENLNRVSNCTLHIWRNGPTLLPRTITLNVSSVGVVDWGGGVLWCHMLSCYTTWLGPGIPNCQCLRLWVFVSESWPWFSLKVQLNTMIICGLKKELHQISIINYIYYASWYTLGISDFWLIFFG